MIDLLALTLSLHLAQATPDKVFPSGPLNSWYKSLKQPKTGMGCCDISDCRPVEARTSGDHWEVFIDDVWWPVPKEIVLENKDNPTGSAVACYFKYPGSAPNFLCFVEPFLI